MVSSIPSDPITVVRSSGMNIRDPDDGVIYTIENDPIMQYGDNSHTRHARVRLLIQLMA
jgi:hypothetical protein